MEQDQCNYFNIYVNNKLNDLIICLSAYIFRYYFINSKNKHNGSFLENFNENIENVLKENIENTYLCELLKRDINLYIILYGQLRVELLLFRDDEDIDLYNIKDDLKSFVINNSDILKIDKNI